MQYIYIYAYAYAPYTAHQLCGITLLVPPFCLTKLAEIYVDVNIRPLAMFRRLLAVFWQGFMVGIHISPCAWRFRYMKVPSSLVDMSSRQQMYQPWKSPCRYCNFLKFAVEAFLCVISVSPGIKNHWSCHIIPLRRLLMRRSAQVLCHLIITGKNALNTKSGAVTRTHPRGLHVKRSRLHIIPLVMAN